MLFQCSFIDNSVSLKNVFIHGLVRDENNQKMSKSLGNVIDPLDLIKEYGADALRYTLITNTTINGDDLSFHQEKIKHG
jgi:valyl-tRNA synthetase